VYQNNDVLHFVLQLFFASDWLSQKEYSFNGPIWSVSIEVLVYFFFFLALRFVSQSALVNVAVLGICATLKIANISHPVVDCMAFFYAGGLSAILCKTTFNLRFRSMLNAFAWGVVLLAPVVSWMFALHEYKHFIYIFMVVYAPAVLFCVSDGFSFNAPTQRVVEAAGNMTYSSYLLHFPLQIIVVMGFTITKTPIPFYEVTFFLMFVTVTLLLSYFVYRYFEAPGQKIIRTWLTK
jgi:peptidoglycan/LPS O-acetylase OafA/YrhL